MAGATFVQTAGSGEPDDDESTVANLGRKLSGASLNVENAAVLEWLWWWWKEYGFEQQLPFEEKSFGIIAAVIRVALTGNKACIQFLRRDEVREPFVIAKNPTANCGNTSASAAELESLDSYLDLRLNGHGEEPPFVSFCGLRHWIWLIEESPVSSYPIDSDEFRTSELVRVPTKTIDELCSQANLSVTEARRLPLQSLVSIASEHRGMGTRDPSRVDVTSRLLPGDLETATRWWIDSAFAQPQKFADGWYCCEQAAKSVEHDSILALTENSLLRLRIHCQFIHPEPPRSLSVIAQATGPRPLDQVVEALKARKAWPKLWGDGGHTCTISISHLRLAGNLCLPDLFKNPASLSNLCLKPAPAGERFDSREPVTVCAVEEAGKPLLSTLEDARRLNVAGDFSGFSDRGQSPFKKDVSKQASFGLEEQSRIPRRPRSDQTAKRDIDWLDDWRYRIELFLSEEIESFKHAPIVFCPDEHAERAMINLGVKYPVSIGFVRDALTVARTEFDNGHKDSFLVSIDWLEGRLKDAVGAIREAEESLTEKPSTLPAPKQWIEGFKWMVSQFVSGTTTFRESDFLIAAVGPLAIPQASCYAFLEWLESMKFVSRKRSGLLKMDDPSNQDRAEFHHSDELRDISPTVVAIRLEDIHESPEVSSTEAHIDENVKFPFNLNRTDVPQTLRRDGYDSPIEIKNDLYWRTMEKLLKAYPDRLSTADLRHLFEDAGPNDRDNTPKRLRPILNAIGLTVKDWTLTEWDGQ